MKSRHGSLNVLLVAAGVLACGDDGGSSSIGTGEATTAAASTAEVPTTGGATNETIVEPTAGPECESAEECAVEVPACRSAACEGGTCVFSDMPGGTALPDQTDGDCVRRECDGAGGVTVVADPEDVEDDGVVCTLDACDGTTPVHVPGMTACYTGDPATAGVGVCAGGVQMCDEAGSPVGPCVGEVLPGAEDCDAGLADEDCDGAVNESGAACICVPGEPAACYGGPDGTVDIGVCQGGVATCAADGLGVGVCEGEVTPSTEDCDGGELDEDCDGAVNESGAACICGDGFVSEGEVCDDGDDDGDACSDDCQTALEVEQIYLGPGGGRTCARITGGRVKCWGVGPWLGLGDTEHRGDDPGEMGGALPFVDLGPGNVVVDMSIGTFFSCAQLADGRVKCWGYNKGGRLGLGDTEHRGDGPGEMGDALPFVDLGPGAKVVQLTSSGGSTCALLMGGALKCWGENSFGEIGAGHKLAIGDGPNEMGAAVPTINLGATPTRVKGGSASFCASFADAKLKCWGYNDQGMLGLGDIQPRGDQPGEMGNNLPYVDFGPGALSDFSVGSHHACVQLADATLRCWGSAYAAAQGMGGAKDIGDMPGEMGNNLPDVDPGGPVLEHDGGIGSVCARLAGNVVKCWGINSNGQLGQGSTEKIGDMPGEMGANLPPVDLGTGRTATRIVMGDVHACAFLDDGTIKCWGQNVWGELGLGDNNPRGDEPGEMGDALPALEIL